MVTKEEYIIQIHNCITMHMYAQITLQKEK
jgi:hypothetical protein